MATQKKETAETAAFAADRIQAAFGDVNERAKSAVEKSTRLVEELTDRYGEPPLPVQNLIAVARFRVGAREVGLTDVALQGNFIKFAPASLPESKTMRLNRMYPGSQVKPNLDFILIPKPKTSRIGGRDLSDHYTLAWMDRYVHPDPERQADAAERLRTAPVPTAEELESGSVLPWRANLMSARYAGALCFTGEIAAYQGNFAEAVRIFEQSVELVRASKIPPMAALREA